MNLLHVVVTASAAFVLMSGALVAYAALILAGRADERARHTLRSVNAPCQPYHRN